MSCLALCSRVFCVCVCVCVFFFFFFFFSHFSIVITSLWEERARLCASRAFVCLFCTRYLYPFSLPLGVRGWLRLVIVALPGLFYELFKEFFMSL